MCPVCFSTLWYGCLGATAALFDVSFLPRPITEFTWTVGNMFSQTVEASLCVSDVPPWQVFQICAKINFHQRSGGNPIPPSPGDESSVFWRKRERRRFYPPEETPDSPCVKLARKTLRGRITWGASFSQGSFAPTSKEYTLMFLIWSLYNTFTTILASHHFIAY